MQDYPVMYSFSKKVDGMDFDTEFLTTHMTLAIWTRFLNTFNDKFEQTVVITFIEILKISWTEYFYITQQKLWIRQNCQQNKFHQISVLDILE